jgi:uncharacterized coiled-coil protein SlyX
MKHLLLLVWLFVGCTATDQALKNEVNIQQEDWNQLREQLLRISSWLDEAQGCCDRVSLSAGLPPPDSLPEAQASDTLRPDSDSLFTAYRATCAELAQLSRQAQRIDGQYQRTRQQFNLFYRKVFDNKLRTGLAQERLVEYRRHLDAFQESLDLLAERFDALATRHNALVEQIANSQPQFMGLGTERIERR